ncbi:hypothetical protein AC579_7869 [Pseudocercospora musae]|uniref:XPG-I domain-containing protein n=1 Tax=Pseudocercospora musae TaxID=113226 RepID=A0A139I2U6_9PEZI|nr:hypothetical protein AC579_7869 [Pseudocercospora musae]
MGINGLWQVLGQGEVTELADYAAAHFEEHKRPLRIAVDEACWRFRNLNEEQVKKIRDGEPAANPMEKTILWRVLRAYKLNIQLLFVWDGMSKPGKDRHRKNGRGGGKVDHEIVKSLHKMFDVLEVPYHRAPGEAEAECAKLQRLGVVDAVWSDDGDSFMFGCTTLIKEHKKDGKKDGCLGKVSIYKAPTILRNFDLDADSMVLFAVLAGGDYDLTGLRGCGPISAKRIAQTKHGLARKLMQCTEGQLPGWRHELSTVLRTCNISLEIPSDFPKWRTVKNYYQPKVTTDEGCWDLPKLHRRGGWERPINEQRLRCELRDRYNFSTREYLKHVAPLFLARALRHVTPHRKQANLDYGIQLKRRGQVDPPKSTANFWYNPQSLVQIDLSTQPPEEDWTKLAAKDGTPYNPMDRIDCHDFSLSLLRHGLPQGALDKPGPAKRKRKAPTVDEDDVEGAVGPSDSPRSAAAHGSSPKRAKTDQDTSGDAKSVRNRKTSQPLPSASPSKFKHVELPEYRSPVQAQASTSRVIDLCDATDSEEDVTAKDASVLTATPIPTPPQPSQQSTALGSLGPSPARAGPKFRPLKSRKSLTSPLPLQKQPQPPSYTAKSKARRPTKPQDDSREKLSDIVSSSVLPMAAASVRVTKSLPSQELGLVSKACQASQRRAQKHWVRPSDLTPGETIPAATLREARASMFATSASNVGPSPAQSSEAKIYPNNVIDLT